jgi:pSer/pThr/pTyr-binding forkhead associated (FHA) protein
VTLFVPLRWLRWGAMNEAKRAVPAETAPELKERIEAEREGAPFLVYRDGEGTQVIRRLAEDERVSIGRTDDADLALEFDSEISRLHAQLERIASDWVVVDDGLSRNGSFVNGERVVGRRRLRDGDALRVGHTLIVFRAPGAAAEETAAAGDTPDASSVSDTQRRVLVALCRPFGQRSEFASPATNRQIAEEVFLSVDAVKSHLRALFERFDVGDLPQNQKRVRLAELAMRSGVVSPRDLEAGPPKTA